MDWKAYPEQQNRDAAHPQEPTGPSPQPGQGQSTAEPGAAPQATAYYPPAGGYVPNAPPYQPPYGASPYRESYVQGQPVTRAYDNGPANAPHVPPSSFAPPPPAPPNPSGAPPYGQPMPPAAGGRYGRGGPGLQPGFPPAQTPGYPSGGQPPYQTGFQPPYPPQAPGAPIYGQPPAYGAPQPVYAPPVDTTRPLFVSASRRVTFPQYKRLNKLGFGPLTATLVVVLILTVMLGVIAILLAYPYEIEGFILTIALTAASEAAGILLAARRAARRSRAVREAYACAEAAGNGEAVLELYHDRVQAVTMRGSSVVPIASAILWEMADMLALAGPGAAVVWRAEDLTPEEGRTLYHLLLQRVVPGCRRTKEPFVPSAPFPLPLPVIRNDDEVKAVVRTHQSAGSIGGDIRAGLGRMLPMLTPLLTILGAYLAANYAITVSFTADILLFALICWGGGLLLAVAILALLSLAKRGKRPESAREVAYAFTRDGMARRLAGGTVFVPHAFIRKRLRAEGVELKTPYGGGLIRWTEVPDPAALKAALDLDGRAGTDRQ